MRNPLKLISCLLLVFFYSFSPAYADSHEPAKESAEASAEKQADGDKKKDGEKKKKDGEEEPECE